MAVAELPTPPGRLYRIGKGDPTAWPPWERVGDGRFDDPTGRRYRILYTGDRRACFVESLARFRPPPRQMLDQMLLPSEVAEAVGRVPPRWLAERRIARLSLRDTDPPAVWVDLREPATHQVLRREMVDHLVGLRFSDFDVSTATSSERRLTQAIGQWAFDRGYQGIVYGSRIDVRLACYAIFEREQGVRPIRVQIRPITLNDPDLVAVAGLFGLVVPTEGAPSQGP